MNQKGQIQSINIKYDSYDTRFQKECRYKKRGEYKKTKEFKKYLCLVFPSQVKTTRENDFKLDELYQRLTDQKVATGERWESRNAKGLFVKKKKECKHSVVVMRLEERHEVRESEPRRFYKRR